MRHHQGHQADEVEAEYGFLLGVKLFPREVERVTRDLRGLLQELGLTGDVECLGPLDVYDDEKGS